MNLWRRRGLQFSLGFGLLCLIILCGCQNPFANPPLVGIILWNKEIQSLDDNLRGVVEGQREEGYLDGLNLRLQVVNSTMDRGRAAVSTQELEEPGARVFPREVPPEIPQVKRLTLNLKSAQALGLPLSRRLLSRAGDLY